MSQDWQQKEIVIMTSKNYDQIIRHDASLDILGNINIKDKEQRHATHAFNIEFLSEKR
jgi:hypothetical protein